MVKKETKKEKELSNIPNIPKEELKEMMKGILGENESGNSQNIDELNKIESLKLIIGALLNDKHLESLTNLTPEEIDDINDAFYLYEYYDNPIILIFIEHRLKLSRSIIHKEPKNLLQTLADIAGRSGINMEGIGESNSILGRLRGK